MKRKPRAVSAIFMLLLMLGNFFMGVSIPVVNALTTGEVYNYSVEIDNKVSSVKGKINVSENDPLYLTDNAYKESIIHFKGELANFETTYNGAITTLDSGILLSNLITNHFASKLTEYNTYMPGDTTMIDVNNISDIKYMKDVEGVSTEFVLLTKSEIETTLKIEYLSSLYSSITNLDTNYNTLISDYQISYNTLLTNIDNIIGNLELEKTNIETYETDELALLNVPNMLVNNSNIYDLIDQAKLDLEFEKTGITISNISTKQTTIDGIKNNVMDKIDAFWLQNKDYTQLGLNTLIDDLEFEYNNANICLTSWFSDINDYKNDNYSNYSSNLDITLINCYKDIIFLEMDYNTLTNSLNTYLLRKPIDKTTIDGLMLNIENFRGYLNSEKVLKHIDNLVDILKTGNEDTIDLLKNFSVLAEVSNTTKHKINNAKLAFYPLSLKSTSSYDLTIRDKYILLNEVVGQLSKTDLVNDIDYGFNFNINELGDYITDISELVIKDRDDNLLKTYNIVIKGDTDSDGDFDNDDITYLHDNLLTITNPTQEQLDRCDFNNDGVIDIADLIEFDNVINGKAQVGTTTSSSIIVDRTEQNNLVYYNVYLKTDGNIKAFQFDIDFSDDLVFNKCEYILTGIKVDDINNPKKIIGMGNYNNEQLLITFIYDKNENSNLSQTTFDLLNVMTINDKYNVETSNKITNIFVKPVPQEEKEEIVVQQIANVEEEIETTSLVEPRLVDEEQETLTNEEEITDEEIVWGNVIKIIIIVLLGTLIIYLLNKNDNEEESKLEEKSKENKKKE